MLTGEVDSFDGVNIGAGSGAFGSLRISGPGAALLYGDRVTIGRAGEIGSGSVLVENGAALSDSGDGISRTTVHGVATVTGAGSLFRARTADINGQMQFADGAFSSVEIWNVAGEVGVADSTINAELAFTGFGGSTTTLTRGAVNASGADVAFDNATLAIDYFSDFDALTLAFTDSALEVGVGFSSIARGHAMITAEVAEFSNATLRLSLLDGFAPSHGDMLHLLSIDESATDLFASPFSTVHFVGDWGGLTAEFDFVMRGSSGGYDAFVTFIPAPGPAGALALAGIGWATRRRRPLR